MISLYDTRTHTPYVQKVNHRDVPPFAGLLVAIGNKNTDDHRTTSVCMYLHTKYQFWFTVRINMVRWLLCPDRLFSRPLFGFYYALAPSSQRSCTVHLFVSMVAEVTSIRTRTTVIGS
jgi:hypothetical protein